MTNIVIVGGSFSAVGTAHRIFKAAAKSPDKPSVNITLVSRDSEFYWNLAATRATVHGQIPDDEIFRPIAGGFAQYGKMFTFILGSATALNTDAQTVHVAPADGSEGQFISYDVLILATGARIASGLPYKSTGSTEATKEALHQLQARVKAAKSIVVAGAGPTGVELAGELADGYGESKQIVLVSSNRSSESLLPCQA
jgi:NADH dehydrogenase FAD-containing subunit